MVEHDWNEVRTAYVTRKDEPSIRALAKEYGIHWTSIARRCSREEWLVMRTEHQKSVGELVKKAQVNSQAHVVHEHIALVDRLVGILDAKLSPTKIVFNTDGTIKALDLPVEPKSYEGMLKQLNDLIRLRLELVGASKKDGPFGEPGDGDAKRPSLNAIIQLINVRTGRTEGMEDLLSIGKDLVDSMDGIVPAEGVVVRDVNDGDGDLKELEVQEPPEINT